MKISISDEDLILILSSLEGTKEIADIAVDTAIKNRDFDKVGISLHILYRVCSLHDKLSALLNEEEN